MFEERKQDFALGLQLTRNRNRLHITTVSSAASSLLNLAEIKLNSAISKCSTTLTKNSDSFFGNDSVLKE
ncbi:hypothetical protein TNCT_121021 [Trichonephila clavata]|uniref:Uncharacterized protein n=1 Tax=Trichonephila clavata TaxID=2740835 RepID=A0A8X6LEF4_TRICU|nr:hypothetical protein TNCT_121021 [Trichonephila clavata]